MPAPVAKGFLARNWWTMLGIALVANVVLVATILAEPDRSRTPRIAQESGESTAAGASEAELAAPTTSHSPQTGTPEPDLRLPGYLPPLKGMPAPQAVAQPAQPAPQEPNVSPSLPAPSPQLQTGMAMVDELTVRLNAHLDRIDAATDKTAALEELNRDFNEIARSLGSRMQQLQLEKWPNEDQQRLRTYAETKLMPTIERMQRLTNLLGVSDEDTVEHGNPLEEQLDGTPADAEESEPVQAPLVPIDPAPAVDR
ncbi:MAG: hypothetical protein EXR77_00510 [Myxococcales bacterium]|nr:hypothetical protein [Myxococcales bacterium]